MDLLQCGLLRHNSGSGWTTSSDSPALVYISQGDAPRNHRITAVRGIVVGTKYPGVSHEGIHGCRCSALLEDIK